MFGITNLGLGLPTKDRPTPPPPTPVRFPQLAPHTDEDFQQQEQNVPLVELLRGIRRPPDIKLSHFEALGVHVISDAPAKEVIPDASFLPPVEEWNAINPDDLLEANEATRRPLNNGNLSPGVQTYRERRKELLTDNTASFRTIRRIAPPPGEVAARLGNAYEFFKNLEFFSTYWEDTSLPAPSSGPTSEDAAKEKPDAPQKPIQQQTHVRSGTGSQLPPDTRQQLLSAFVKLVAYDFGCNVAFNRNEPRLHLTPSASSPKDPPSYFNSSVSFVFRTPTDRASARAGIVEGPVAALSARASTVFATKAEERLDLAREVVAILIAAQHRARNGKTEKRFGEGKWWTTVPRWGGGPGGPIGREGDVKSTGEHPSGPEKLDASASSGDPNSSSHSHITIADRTSSSVTAEAKRAIGGISGPVSSPSKRTRRGGAAPGGNMQIYDNYRRLHPPAPTWDRKARYSAIGRAVLPGAPGGDAATAEAPYDDVFLLSALNHHISIVRARVPSKLLDVLDGECGEGVKSESRERMCIYRTRWFDMFLAEDRVEAMGIVWGMMAYLMRKVDVGVGEGGGGGAGKAALEHSDSKQKKSSDGVGGGGGGGRDGAAEKMDLT